MSYDPLLTDCSSSLEVHTPTMWLMDHAYLLPRQIPDEIPKYSGFRWLISLKFTSPQEVEIILNTAHYMALNCNTNWLISLCSSDSSFVTQDQISDYLEHITTFSDQAYTSASNLYNL